MQVLFSNVLMNFDLSDGMDKNIRDRFSGENGDIIEPEDVYKRLPGFFEKGDIIGAKTLIGEMAFRADTYYSKVTIISILISIFETEVALESENTVFDDYSGIESFIDKYIQLKLYVHRMEFNVAPETYEEIYHYCVNKHISFYFIQYLISHNTVYTKDTYRRFAELFFSFEDERSLYGNLFARFAEK